MNTKKGRSRWEFVETKLQRKSFIR